MNREAGAVASDKLEAYSNRQCLCGHAFGNHSLFSGCMICPCNGAHDKPPLRIDYQPGDFTGAKQ